MGLFYPFTQGECPGLWRTLGFQPAFKSFDSPSYGGHWAFLLRQAASRAQPILAMHHANNSCSGKRQSRLQNSKFKIQNSKLKIQNSKLRSVQQFKTQNSKLKIALRATTQNSKFKIQNSFYKHSSPSVRTPPTCRARWQPRVPGAR